MTTETHFVVNMDNKKTLGFKGQEKVDYADVASGGEGMTLVFRLSGGVNSKLEAPFMIFMNKNKNYPIIGVPDNVPGVTYRTGPRGWMDRRVFLEWLEEPRAIDTHPDGQRILFLDNCTCHDETTEQLQALEKINTKLKKLPPNATHLCQPLDSFVIKNFKDIWRKEWETTKHDLIDHGHWSNQPSGSGKLKNPGKTYFLNLAAKCVNLFNNMRDSNNISYARKAMIRCGLALDVDGIWKVSQLSNELQEIVARHHLNFCGVEPAPFGNNEESSENES